MDHNLNAYDSAALTRWYGALQELTAAEKIVFEDFRQFIPKSRLLDIGIGGGRTTRYLVGKCGSYTGIDYAGKFVRTVRKKYPDSDLRLMDARDLSAFENSSFDFINFSLNGIDYVNAFDREKIFMEIQRVLRPGGIFFFSTHNKDHPSFNKKPWLDPSTSLFTNFKTFLSLLPFLLRHLSQKKYESHSEHYAIINDSAHQYKLLTFYTTVRFLKEQLRHHHFEEVCLLSKTGTKRSEKSLDDWIFVTCKKSAL